MALESSAMYDWKRDSLVFSRFVGLRCGLVNTFDRSKGVFEEAYELTFRKWLVR